MSLQTVQAKLGGTIRPGYYPCIGIRDPNYEIPAVFPGGVKLGDTIQIVLPGTPPYNLTQVILSKRPAVTGWCGATFTELKTNTFNWTVATIPSSRFDSPDTPSPPELFDVGMTMYWNAVEINQTEVQSVPYYSSPNFTRVDGVAGGSSPSANPTSTASSAASANPTSGAYLRLRGPKRLRLIGWVVVWLAIAGLIA